MDTACEQSTKASISCWGCRKQRLVCDMTLPGCRKCKKAGKDCLGYANQKPLQWVGGGKISSEKKKKDVTKVTKAGLTTPRTNERRGYKVTSSANGSFSAFRLDIRASAANSKTAAVAKPHSDWGIDDTPKEVQALAKQWVYDIDQATMASLRCMQLPDVLPLSSLSQWDVQLYHFYGSRTSLTLAGQNTLGIWQTQVYDDAKNYSFVMHSLLAMSALHASRIEPQRTSYFSYMASRHCELAVSKFRATVSMIDAHNSRAFAMFSIFMAVYSLGIPSFRGFPAETSAVSMILDIIGTLRRAWAALGAEGMRMRTSHLKNMLSPNLITPLHNLQDSNHDLLKDIEGYIQICGETEEVKEIYHKDIHSLIGHFFRLPSYAPFSDFLGWPMEFSDTFYEHLCARKPVPMFFLAYIMVPFYHTPNMWLSPWAKPVIQEIWMTMDPSLHPFLYWPAKYAGLVPCLAHCVGCRCFDCFMLEKPGGFKWISNATPLIAGKRYVPSGQQSFLLRTTIARAAEAVSTANFEK